MLCKELLKSYLRIEEASLPIYTTVSIHRKNTAKFLEQGVLPVCLFGFFYQVQYLTCPSFIFRLLHSLGHHYLLTVKAGAHLLFIYLF